MKVLIGIRGGYSLQNATFFSTANSFPHKKAPQEFRSNKSKESPLGDINHPAMNHDTALGFKAGVIKPYRVYV
jgi:hypothetical protein